jgi:molybdenum cofactor cytidylyltransferase
VILAAGNSERMGQLKPFLRFNESLTFLERIVHIYQNQKIDKILVVVNDDVYQKLQKTNLVKPDSCKYVLNHNPEYGRFHSIKIGLKEVQSGSLVFLQNIDNPFVTEITIQSLINEIDDADYAVPVFDGNSGHPILVSPNVVNTILQTQDRRSNLRNILASFQRCEVRISDPGILVNINTPDDYHRYF